MRARIFSECLFVNRLEHLSMLHFSTAAKLCRIFAQRLEERAHSRPYHERGAEAAGDEIGEKVAHASAIAR